jgi:hypothetical protein
LGVFENVDYAFDAFHSVAMVNAYLSILLNSDKIRQLSQLELPAILVNRVINDLALNKQELSRQSDA